MPELDRKQAMDAIDEESLFDPEYTYVLDEGEKRRQEVDLELLREHNAHKEKSKAQAIGWLGVVFGDKEHAPLWIAILSILIGATVWGATLFFGRNNPSISAAMAEHASKGWTLIFTALGYVFGQQSANK